MAVDDSLGSVAISIRRELQFNSSSAFQYRCIVRTANVRVLLFQLQFLKRFQNGYQSMIIPEERIPTKSEVTYRDVLPLVLPDVPLTKFRAAKPDAKLYDSLMKLDECVVCHLFAQF